jgi:carboxylate-amine ligase
VALAALAQALVVKLYRLRRSNLGFRIYPRSLVEENKWRAMRHGIDGKLIDFGRQAEVPMRDLTLELLEFVDDVVDDLGSRDAVNHVHQILADGSGADRQLKVYRQTGDMRRVVEFLIHETMRGVPYAEALGLPATDMTPIAPET